MLDSRITERRMEASVDMDAQRYDWWEGHWQEVWRSCLASHSAAVVGEWKSPWLDTHAVNGTRLRDGDPIFSAVCHERRMAAKLVQCLNWDREPAILYVRLSIFNPEGDDIRVMTVGVPSTGASVEAVQGWWHLWLIGGIPGNLSSSARCCWLAVGVDLS